MASSKRDNVLFEATELGNVDRSIIDKYQELNEKCDLVLEKLKRKSKKTLTSK